MELLYMHGQETTEGGRGGSLNRKRNGEGDEAGVAGRGGGGGARGAGGFRAVGWGARVGSDGREGETTEAPNRPHHRISCPE